ncbi:MAG TPA: hypothetical protein VHX92_08660 [Rhizomicrobium sp.]|jgi:hypothetical protein|nr:hypothetical protein [Rhizomicrobium sp.]
MHLKKWLLWYIGGFVWVFGSFDWLYTRDARMLNIAAGIICYPNDGTQRYINCVLDQERKHSIWTIFFQHDWLIVVIPPIFVFLVLFVRSKMVANRLSAPAR